MMSSSKTRSLDRLAVIGAGNMGSGIAQKMATEGFSVVLVDLDDEKVTRGLDTIKRTLAEGVERKLFRPVQANEILARVHGTTDWQQLTNVDLVVEAVFEDLDVKRDVFRRLEASCGPDTVLGTNTSSFSVSEVAESIERPERVVGLHYFYHPAKNRLVEVVPSSATDPGVLRATWALQERIGKTPIASSDASGFVVNRFFVPWLNEAVRLMEEGVADVPTIEAACKRTFGVGMGPFELMNVTGVPIALHAATTLGRVFGTFYAPCAALATQVESGESWDLGGEPDESKFAAVDERMLPAVFYVAAALVGEGVGSVEDTDIGARVGLRWPRGPFEMINRVGVAEATTLVRGLAGRWDLDVPQLLQDRVDAGSPFAFQLVRRETRDGVATLTINRPDAMNALNETVVSQLHAAFRGAAEDPAVRGIVIAGAGKAFIAGADIRFFVRNLDSGDIDRIVAFTEAGHALLNDIDRCPKPVVARLHGLALGGGLELALACDRIIGTAKASVAFPETGIGIYPGLGGTQRTPRRTGAPLAKWLIYTGEMLGARNAAEIGLIDRTVPVDALDEAVHSEASGRKGDHDTIAGRPSMVRLFGSHSVASLREGEIDAADDKEVARAVKQVGFKAPVALELAEKLIDGGTEVELQQGLQLELDHLREIFLTEDAYEGLTALGKRRPEFKGR
jgi:enoyl-CoA hydratase/3-hydroxyacyl-CoA dehydrogenase